MNSQIQSLPKFFNYREEGPDSGYETIQDFYLSWMLRCSEDKYHDINPKLHQYARIAVFMLIYGYNASDGYILGDGVSDDFRIKRVITRRQFKRIDLVAEIEIELKSSHQKFVLNIENKWYTKVRDSQLKSSREEIEKEYSGKGFEIMNFVIFLDNCIIARSPLQKELADKNNYKLLTIGDIQRVTGMSQNGETGNYMFDEFWLYFKGRNK